MALPRSLKIPTRLLISVLFILGRGYTTVQGVDLAVPSILLTLVTRGERGEEGGDRDPGRWTPSLRCPSPEAQLV